MEIELPEGTIIALIGTTLQFNKFNTVLSHPMCICAVLAHPGSFIYWASYCVLGTLMGSGDRAVTKTDQNRPKLNKTKQTTPPRVSIMRSKKNKAIWPLWASLIHQVLYIHLIWMNLWKSWWHHFTKEETKAQIESQTKLPQPGSGRLTLEVSHVCLISIQLSSVHPDIRKICRNIKQCYSSHYIVLEGLENIVLSH